jgi:hypothetical protein
MKKGDYCGEARFSLPINQGYKRDFVTKGQ